MQKQIEHQLNKIESLINSMQKKRNGVFGYRRCEQVSQAQKDYYLSIGL